jgi:hypothetical protein
MNRDNRHIEAQEVSTPLNQPLVVIACKVLENMVKALLPDNWAAQIIFMDYGLHRSPRRMTLMLQQAIDSLCEPSLVILGYGLCGKGLAGIEAGDHTLLVPRVDDCIALLLGSHETYMREFEKEPGTYYLSKGWLESGSHPLSEYEENKAKYGHEKAAWIMDQQYGNYSRLVLVTHNRADMDRYRPQAEAVARYCSQWGMALEEILGSDQYVRRLIEVAGLMHRADDDFVLIPPGGRIRQEQFMRQQVAGITQGK